MLWVAFVLALIALPILLFTQALFVRRRVIRLPAAQGAITGQMWHPARSQGGAVHRVVHVLALGESPVAGVGVEQHEDGLPANVARALAEHYHSEGAEGEEEKLSFTWHAIGRSGVTAARARQTLLPQLRRHLAEHVRLENDGERTTFVVLVSLGVNDTFQLTGQRSFQYHLQRFVDEVDTILRVHCAARGRDEEVDIALVVAGVADIGRFPGLPQPLRWLAGWRSRQLDAAAQQVALRSESLFVPSVPEGEFFSVDGIHPSSHGYRRWGANVGAELLRQPRSTLRRSKSAML